MTAQVGIIDLDAPGEGLSLVALLHDLQEPVLELPGGVVAEAELAGQLQRREADLALGQQVDGQEPSVSGSCVAWRGVAWRGVAWKMVPAVLPQSGPYEPLGSAILDEGRSALRFGAVLIEKRRQ